MSKRGLQGPRRWFVERLGDRRTWIGLAVVGLCVAAGKPQNLEQALAAQRALVEQDPSDARLLNDLGNLLVLAGSLEEAEQTYRRALQQSPVDVTTRYNLALVLQELGHDRKAMKELAEIVELEPRHAWAHYQLGTLCAATGRRAKALRHYEMAFSLDRSLTSPAVNPHIVENRLVTEALLRSYVSESPSTQAPRLYRQPASVADLLLPPPPEAQGEPVAPAGAVASDRPARAESEPRETVAAPEDAGARTPIDWRDEPPAEGDAKTPIDWRDEPPAETGQPVPRAPSSQPRPAPPAARERTPPFRPDLPSTGRLEPRLVPAAETVATAPVAP